MSNTDGIRPNLSSALPRAITPAELKVMYMAIADGEAAFSKEQPIVQGSLPTFSALTIVAAAGLLGHRLDWMLDNGSIVVYRLP